MSLLRAASHPAAIFCLQLAASLAVGALVPYTEIDWSTYREQVDLVRRGERVYSAIGGATGPLVYPAVHVWVYIVLAKVEDASVDPGLLLFRPSTC